MIPVFFKNEGLLPLEAVTTMGVSAKEGDAPIGYFGTGLKYAIACVLRNGGTFDLWLGERRIWFTTETIRVRGKEFERVVMGEGEGALDDDHQTLPLGFTTDLGKHWKPWMAMREIVSNTIDEGGTVKLAGAPESYVEEGYTVVRVDGWTAFLQAVENRGHYFLTSGSPIYEGAGATAFPGPGRGVYYRRVRVSDSEDWMFRWNLTGHTDLTEDRTLRYPWQATSPITATVAQSSDEGFIRRVLSADPREHKEGKLDFDGCGVDPSPEFMRVVGAELDRGRMGNINRSAINLAVSYNPDLFSGREDAPNESQAEELAAVYEVMRSCGWDSAGKLPVLVTPVLNYGRGLGFWDGTNVILSHRAFDMGPVVLLGTVAEEYMHAVYSFQDETRDFQNFLVDRLSRLMIELHELRSGAPSPVNDDKEVPF